MATSGDKNGEKNGKKIWRRTSQGKAHLDTKKDISGYSLSQDVFNE
jgi:hypothetical protein